jgi:hypothetical protein
MIKFHDLSGLQIAEVTDADYRISNVQDAVDLLGDLYFNNSSRIILHEINFHPDFFRLHTGFAGDILQKFSNYKIKFAIIGDFSKYKSKPLQDFICESNKGNRVFFVTDIDEAFIRLKK